MNHFSNRMLSIGFIGVLLIGLLAISITPYAAEDNQRAQNAEDILMNLSDAERQALNELESSKGFMIDPDINQNSGEFVSIIVEFKRAPAKVEMLKKQSNGQKFSLSSAQEDANSDHEVFKNYL